MNNRLPAAFLERMRAQFDLREEFDAFLSSYEKEPKKGLRVNTLKIQKEEFERISPFALRPIPWEKNGFYVEEKTGRHPYHFAGLYYSQEPSAMSVVPLLDARQGDKVLDLCAAPGGKSTQIAQALGESGLLVCNEINSSRAFILSQNVERLGIKNAVVLNASPKDLAEKFVGFFDKILVDAPCSGEGMFKKNEKEALENWSVENVELCAARQREILSYAAVMLKQGGKLVYSTCTFSKEEDEEQVQRFLSEHPDFSCEKQQKLYPHNVDGEGHFYAVLQKDGAAESKPLKEAKTNLSKKETEIFEDFCKGCLRVKLSGSLYKAGDFLYLLPKGVFSFDKLPVLRAGIRLGEVVKDRFVPAHAFAMALKKEEVKRAVCLSVEQSEKYLKGETVPTDEENGWALVCVEDYPLGWGKISGGVAKNHYPKGLRLMK